MSDSVQPHLIASNLCMPLRVTLACALTTRRQLINSQRLQQATAALLRKLSLEEVLKTICAESQQLTEAQGGSIFLSEEHGGMLLASSTGMAPTPIAMALPATQLCPKPDTTPPHHQRNDHLPVIDNAPAPAAWGYAPDAHLTALLAIPLRLRTTIIGSIHLVNKPGGFSAQDADLMRCFADQASIAIERARLSQQVERIAILEERQRLARELHDSVTQSLYSMTLYAEAATRHLGSGNLETAAQYLHDVRASAREALHEMRLLIFELRPPILEQEGLVAALQARLEAVEKRAGLQTELHVEIEQPLPPVVGEELYRIAQEALNNVLKHAQAHHVTLHLSSDEQNHQIIMEVCDDGVGCDIATLANQNGLGLHTMAERAWKIGGTLTLESSPGSGMTVRTEIIMKG